MFSLLTLIRQSNRYLKCIIKTEFNKMWLSMLRIVYTLLVAHTKAANPTSAKALFVHKKLTILFFAMYIRLVYLISAIFSTNYRDIKIQT